MKLLCLLWNKGKGNTEEDDHCHSLSLMIHGIQFLVEPCWRAGKEEHGLFPDSSGLSRSHPTSCCFPGLSASAFWRDCGTGKCSRILLNASQSSRAASAKEARWVRSPQLCVTLCDPTDSLVHGILQQEYWPGSPCPPPGGLPDPVIKPVSPRSPPLAGVFFTISTTWEASTSLHEPNKWTRF